MRKLTAVRYFLSGVLLFSFHWCFGQNVRSAVKAPYTRTNAYSRLQHDVFSFGGNQAALAQQKQVGAGVYGERRFLLQDLSLYQLNIALPTSSGNFGAAIMRFGGNAYNETAAGLAYARKLGEKLDIGVQFNYYSIQIAGYGSGTSVNAEAGIIFRPTEQMNVGLHVYNPTGSGIGRNKEERLPAIYSFGFGWDASEKLFVGAEVQKEENQPVTVNAGIQYNVGKVVFARGGVSSASSAFYLGTGLVLHQFRLDVTASVHPHLGVTPGLMLIYNWNK